MMRRTQSIGLAVAALRLVLGSSAKAQDGPSLSLDYTVSSTGGGLYLYNFTLGIDASSGSFSAGQGWGWVVFGDTMNAPSPLSDFSLVGSIQDGPWNVIQSTGGYDNGPTLGPVGYGDNQFYYWEPAQNTDTITCSWGSDHVLGGQTMFLGVTILGVHHLGGQTTPSWGSDHTILGVRPGFRFFYGVSTLNVIQLTACQGDYEFNSMAPSITSWLGETGGKTSSSTILTAKGCWSILRGLSGAVAGVSMPLSCCRTTFISS
jgi:hypothetical protein